MVQVFEEMMKETERDRMVTFKNRYQRISNLVYNIRKSNIGIRSFLKK